MATLRETHRRNEVSEDLIALEGQANSGIDQLKAVRTNLLNLKQAVNSEEQFSEEDAAEVQAVVTALAERIQQELLGG